MKGKVAAYHYSPDRLSVLGNVTQRRLENLKEKENFGRSRRKWKNSSE